MKPISVTLARSRLPSAWLGRFGIGGFLFFLVKGLLWLTVPALLAVAGLE
jgi:hypothetical protein